MSKKLERSNLPGEIRAVEGSDAGEGIIEGYLTKWDTVDSYDTMFKKGAFSKSFKTRGIKNTRLVWNHGRLAGKILELREDDFGPFFVGQCNLETEAGKECYAHVKAGDVNCNSFGFNTVADKWINQIRQITEVDMLECGPVVFEANDAAKITDVRAGEIEGKRAIDFDETQKMREMSSKGWQLLNSLERTLDDIMYQGANSATRDEKVEQIDTAIAKFHAAYVAWLKEWYEMLETRDAPHPCEHRNNLQTVAAGIDADELVKTTTLTADEVRKLKGGQVLPIEARNRLKSADPELFAAHQSYRAQVIENLCDELRTGTLTDGEAERVRALLKLSNGETTADMSKYIDDLRSDLLG